MPPNESPVRAELDRVGASFRQAGARLELRVHLELVAEGAVDHLVLGRQLHRDCLPRRDLIRGTDRSADNPAALEERERKRAGLGSGGSVSHASDAPNVAETVVLN